MFYLTKMKRKHNKVWVKACQWWIPLQSHLKLEL
jgi:hypothetical protein